MKSSIELREAGYADIVYVARHMRLIDRTELYAFDETENPEKLARELTLYERYHWCAFIDWRPVTIISAIEQSPTLWRVGMFSTEEWPKVALSCTRFFYRTMAPTIYDLGCNRAECRSIVSHTEAHKWLDSLGAMRECTIHDVGPKRESYIQFSWTREKTKKDWTKRRRNVSLWQA